MPFPRQNALDQALDIAGSLTQTSTMTLTDEPAGLGAPIAGQTGIDGYVTSVLAGVATITGLTGMTAQSIGRFLTATNSPNTNNNGTFLIVAFNSATSVNISNPSAVAPDGYFTWVERQPYCLEDDLNFERTDRTAIKGVAYSAAIPTYLRPTATGTPVPANLLNIAGKTTDARGFIINRAFYRVDVANGLTKVTLSSPGNLKHSDSVDFTGIPVFDSGPYTGDYKACYVEINDGYTDNEVTVQTGPHKGEKVFGITNGGSSVSPNSVEVLFYSAPHGSDILVNSTPYTWDDGYVTLVSCFYGYFQRLDQIPDDAFRVVNSLGLEADADLRQDVNDLQSSVGTPDGYNSLSGLLTNIVAYFPFFNLPSATPSVVDALNTLNAQIGNRTYTGTTLTSGQTITASLQALSNAISGTNIVRVIERLAADIIANTPHTLPGAHTYTLDGTDNGQFLWVFTRGVLRDPGSVANGNDYTETSTTQVTFYAKQKAGDHINYFIKS